MDSYCDPVREYLGLSVIPLLLTLTVYCPQSVVGKDDFTRKENLKVIREEIQSELSDTTSRRRLEVLGISDTDVRNRIKRLRDWSDTKVRNLAMEIRRRNEQSLYTIIYSGTVYVLLTPALGYHWTVTGIAYVIPGMEPPVLDF